MGERPSDRARRIVADAERSSSARRAAASSRDHPIGGRDGESSAFAAVDLPELATKKEETASASNGSGGEGEAARSPLLDRLAEKLQSNRLVAWRAQREASHDRRRTR